MTLLTPSKPARKKRAKKKPQRGKELFNYVVQKTGLPKDKIKAELAILLKKKNIEISQLTVDQLRVVVASYLREIMAGILEHIPHKSKETEH